MPVPSPRRASLSCLDAYGTLHGLPSAGRPALRVVSTPCTLMTRERALGGRWEGAERALASGMRCTALIQLILRDVGVAVCVLTSFPPRHDFQSPHHPPKQRARHQPGPVRASSATLSLPRLHLRKHAKRQPSRKSPPKPNLPRRDERHPQHRRPPSCPRQPVPSARL